MTVYITDIAAFLPNAPVANEDIERVIGMVHQRPSRTRNVILRTNKIEQRYYAIDPSDGRVTHSNAELTAEAIRRLKPCEGHTTADIECLCCGTSSPDQMLPGHALMVHGELASAPCEVISTAGICLAGIASLKYAYMSVGMGLTRNAVATGSELASTLVRAEMWSDVDLEKAADLASHPKLNFDADFLRWMLSDGAGAAYLTAERPGNRPALQINWIDLVSFAHELEPCMYSGATKNPGGRLTGWRNHPSLHDAVRAGSFLVKQDVKLLNQEILRTAVDRTLPGVVARRGLDLSSVTWFLPHYSSDYFRQRLYDQMASVGCAIPIERWFTNLATKGNTGSASIYIILEELFHSGRLRQGDTLLCVIPESGRFSVAYMLLTVV